MPQLLSSKDYVVYVNAVLGELDYRSPQTWFRANPADQDPTTNCLLQMVENEMVALAYDLTDKLVPKVDRRK